MDEVEFLNLAQGYIKQLNESDIFKNDIPFEFTQLISDKGLPFKSCLELRDSPIHGKGVFATKDIEPDKVVAIYPCHSIIYNSNMWYTTKKYTELLKQYNENISNIPIDRYNIELTRNEKTAIWGIPDIYDEYNLAHLINDSYNNISGFSNIKMKTDTTYFGDIMVNYIVNSNQYNNCNHQSLYDFVYTKSSKHIKAGEELLTCYGFNYWCKNLGLTKQEIIKIANNYIESLPPEKQDETFNLISKSSSRYLVV
jgi:hypothetical protein